MTTNYKAIVSAAKTAARDIQRSKWIMNLLDQVKTVETKLMDLQKLKANVDKELAIVQFTYDQGVANGDPRVEDYKEKLDAKIKQTKENTTDIEEKVETHTKEKEALKKKIADVETGELKVSKEIMDEKAKELITLRITDDFVNGDYDTKE